VTPEEREARIKEFVDKHHLTLAEAEFTVALEEGEVDGCVVAIEVSPDQERRP
jgi:hypothetical protein